MVRVGANDVMVGDVTLLNIGLGGPDGKSSRAWKSRSDEGMDCGSVRQAQTEVSMKRQTDEETLNHVSQK